MKEHNQLSYAVRIQRGIRLLVGLDEEGDGVTRLAESLQPQFSPWGREDWAALIGEVVAAQRVVIAAVAGEFGSAALVNPTTTHIAIVESVGEEAVAAQRCTLEGRLVAAAVTPDLTTIAAGFARDRRAFPDLSLSRMRLHNGTAPNPTFGGVSFDELIMNVQRSHYFRALPYILLPGEALAAIHQTAGVATRFYFTWREVRLLPGQELAT